MARILQAATFIIGCWLITSSDSADISFDDTTGLSRVFEGIGGLSGGGATSKLLINYPKAQRDEILDYLFKPNFGASLQILKVEIGGDAQSTDGTEASHMHNSWEENYERGYEWWLMVEAKKRNPDIKLYGLPWGFPGWIANGSSNLSPYEYPAILADYVVKWVNGAKTHYNLTIDCVGIWNERPYNIPYIKTLRNLLDQRGFQNVLITASDGGWEIAPDIQKDADLERSVHSIGAHYPGTSASGPALSSGKALWASEDYSTYNDEIGAGCWARILNQNFVNGYMTSTISWNLIASYYQGLPYFRDGLMTAVEPWSGHYVVDSPIWISAHTTQFTSIGWRYLPHNFGVGKLPNGGSYVSLTNPKGSDLTIIIETMTRNHSVCIRPNLSQYSLTAQNITLHLKGSFAKITHLQVWYTKLGFNGNVSQTFIKKAPLTFVNGSAQLSLGLDEVYTLTTLTTGVKGSTPAQPPASAQYPVPYNDDFEGYQLYAEPYNLVPQTGSFEVISSVANNKVIRQTVLSPPIAWCSAEGVKRALALIGSNSWADLFIEVDFEIPNVNGTDGVFVAQRIDQSGCNTAKAHGIYLFAFKSNYTLANDLARTIVITQGALPTGSGKHKLSLFIQGHTAIGGYDGQNIFNVTIPTRPSQGFAGIGTDSFGLADFDNLHIDTHP